MLLINKLNHLEGFSEIDKTIVDYILTNYKEILNMNIEEFSSANFVSNSTIVRFCQKLGFKGFTDFKITLASEINTFTKGDKRVEVDVPFTKKNEVKELPEIFLNLYNQTLVDIYPHVDIEMIDKVAKVLHKADVISLWAQGPSLVLALDYQYKMKKLGYVLTVDQLMGFHQIPMVQTERTEVAMIISSYGISDEVMNWLKYHKQAGNITVMICLNPSSPYIKLADYAIVLDTFEERIMKLGHFATKIAMSYILDIIYATMFKLDYDNNIKILEATGKVLKVIA